MHRTGAFFMRKSDNVKSFGHTFVHHEIIFTTVRATVRAVFFGISKIQ